MASRVTQYPTPPPIRSSLLKNPPDAIPSIDDLELLQEDLRKLKQRTIERMKKAGEDIIAIQESFKRIKEKEKGKGKAVEKVKKERGRAYIYLVMLPLNLKQSYHVVLFMNMHIPLASLRYPTP